jgi:hypothetical protein
LVCQAFVTLAFGARDRFSQKIVVADQVYAPGAVAEYTLAPSQTGATKTRAEDVMSQDSIFGLPIPVALALVATVLVVLALGRVLLSLTAPVRVREPGCAVQCDTDEEEPAWPH